MRSKSGLVTLCVLVLMVATGFLGFPTYAAPGHEGCTPWFKLLDSNGNPLAKGYDEFGYNYGAHMFNGIYSDYDRVHGGPYSDVTLIMKWNDAWLSAYDCDNDGKLDRPPSYIGSSAWLTNHQFGRNPDGSHWEYFVKIVALDKPIGVGGYTYSDDDSSKNLNYGDRVWDGDRLVGLSIWGAFVTIQSVYNDPSIPAFGIEFLVQPAGFGVAG